MRLLKKAAVSVVAAVALVLAMASVALANTGGVYTINYIDVETGELIAPSTVVTDAPYDETITEVAPEIDGCTLVGPEEHSFALTYNYNLIVDTEWSRITPCNKLTWVQDGDKYPITVVKKGNKYVVWTPDKLTAAEQDAVYQAFRSNVNGMFGAKFKNVTFVDGPKTIFGEMYFDPNTLTFEFHSTWSFFASGAYEVQDISEPAEFDFYYTRNRFEWR